MTIRIPPKADQDLRNAFLDVEERLRKLESKPPEKISEGVQIPQTPADLDLDVEGDLRVANDVRIEGSIDAPHLYDGLFELAPSGYPNDAQRVMNLHSSLVIAPGGLSADSIKSRFIATNRIDSNVIGCRVYLTGDDTISNTTVTYIPWDAAVYDTHGFWSSGADITIPTGLSGQYLCILCWRFDTEASGRAFGGICMTGDNTTLDGSGYGAKFEAPFANTYTGATTVQLLDLDAGEAINGYVYQSSGGNATLRVEETSLVIQRIGPKIGDTYSA